VLVISKHGIEGEGEGARQKWKGQVRWKRLCGDIMTFGVTHGPAAMGPPVLLGVMSTV
jgi:hypothetical protein